MLERESFSPSIVGVSSSNMEASQPWITQRKRRFRSQTGKEKTKIQKKNEQLDINYINEAIVKLETHNGGDTTRFSDESFVHHRTDDGFGLRAWVGVEIRPEFGRRKGWKVEEEEEEEEREDAIGHWLRSGNRIHSVFTKKVV